MDANEPNFNGKVLALTVGSDGEGLILASPTFEQQCGRVFLVGAVPPAVGVWAGGSRGAVAWDAVTDYLVFDSIDEYLNRAARHRPSLRERLWG